MIQDMIFIGQTFCYLKQNISIFNDEKVARERQSSQRTQKTPKTMWRSNNAIFSILDFMIFNSFFVYSIICELKHFNLVQHGWKQEIDINGMVLRRARFAAQECKISNLNSH